MTNVSNEFFKMLVEGVELATPYKLFFQNLTYEWLNLCRHTFQVQHRLH
jgi:hypothetical protein